ncbi:hypothetical protein [Candidatus Vidania fulgoroideorum]
MFINKILENKKIELKYRKFKINIINIFNIYLRKIKFKKIFTINNNIIPEIKKFSPIKKNLSNKFNFLNLLNFYKKIGAKNLSILSEQMFFGGNYLYIVITKCLFNFKIIRKDFLINEYQILESFIINVDIILIITNIINSKLILNFIKKYKKIIFLLEINKIKEIKFLNKKIMNNNLIIGVNNRNLINFKIKKNKSILFLKKNKIISESGINSIFNMFKKKKYSNFLLIGEYFIKKNEYFY